MPAQFITDNKGQKVAVIVPIGKSIKMMDELEELADIKAYDKAKTRKQEFVLPKSCLVRLRKSGKIPDVMNT